MIFPKTLPFSILFLFMLSLGSSAQDTSFVDVGGALRFNGLYKNWEGEKANQDKGGKLGFDTFYLTADAEKNGLYLSAQYRFYQGYHFLRYGYIGGDISENMSLKLGVVQVPFGMLSFASNSWFFSMPYYLGLEDDYDAGLVWEYQPGRWDFHAAFFKNSEGSYSGTSAHSARFSYDVVGNSEEVNQGNIRAAYAITENWEFGFSGQYGQLYNNVSGNFGDHRAFAAHLKGSLGGLGIKSEFIELDFNPTRPYDHLPGTVKMGAYDFPYHVARRGRIYLIGLNYDFDVDWGPIDMITIYEDFSYFEKDVPGFRDSKMNIAGFRVDAGNLSAYFDVASGQSHPWLGPAWTEAFARGADTDDPTADAYVDDPQVDWTTRFNVNLGYYF